MIMRLALLLTIFTISQLAMSNSSHFDMRADYIHIQDSHYLAISFQNEKGWHSYWKNPGDAGLPVKILFEDISPEELTWPAPHRYIQSEVLSYGYSGTYTFFYKLLEADMQTLSLQDVDIKSQVLICNDICIPGKDEIKIRLTAEKIQHKNNKPSFSLSQESLEKAFASLPKTKQASQELELEFLTDSEKLYLLYTISQENLGGFHFDQNLITPYPNDLLAFYKESLYFDNGKVYGLMEVDWEGEYAEPPIALPKVGNLLENIQIDIIAQLNGDVVKSSLTISELKKLDAGLIQKIKKLKPFDSKTETVDHASSETSLLLIILFAILGGFVLNLMPCVLPVISIKLIGLIKSRAESPKRLLKHNLSYTAGVISTFLALAAVVHLIQSTGQQIGWGFQLQSPSFVFFVLIIIFMMALNMLGLFEFRTPGGHKLGSTHLNESFTGDFFSGVISTILSTPCSAPFLGTALTYAFTTSAFNIYLIFVFIGLGLALPFIIIGFFPRLICFLPKPGNWMNKLKIFLGSTLILTVCWLLYIFIELTQSNFALIYTLIILASIFMAFFTFKKLKKNNHFLKAFAWLIPICLTVGFFAQDFNQAQKPAVKKVANKNWKAWGPEIMQDQGIKFINFTAQWCLTCKVNKKLVLDTQDFYQFSKEKKIELFEADWTHYDEVISKWLAKYDVVGVPAYFLQKENGDIIYLGETTSISEIKEKL